MAKRPNETICEYVVSTATMPLDELTKEGLGEVPEHITQAIDEKSSPYLAGFAMGINMASHILEAFVGEALREVLERYGNEYDFIADRVVRTVSVFKAVEYLSCRTLFDRGYAVDGEDNSPKVVH